jgi:DNA-binding transcriptional MerR regulator
MNNYQTVSTVARNLKASESDLLDLEKRKWIHSVARNGSVFLSGKDAYKARFILHLRRLHLTDEEIGRVLDARNPPYSLADVPKILGRPVQIKS